MDSVIIVTSRGFDLGQLRRTIPLGYCVNEAANERIVIESGGQRAYLGADARIADEMEPEEASRIVGMIPARLTSAKSCCLQSPTAAMYSSTMTMA